MSILSDLIQDLNNRIFNNNTRFIRGNSVNSYLSDLTNTSVLKDKLTTNNAAYVGINNGTNEYSHNLGTDDIQTITIRKNGGQLLSASSFNIIVTSTTITITNPGPALANAVINIGA